MASFALYNLPCAFMLARINAGRDSCMLNAVNVKPQLSYCAFEFSVSKHLCKASYLTLPFSAPLQLYTTWHVCSFAVVERAEAG